MAGSGMALITVLTLSLFGSYVHALRKSVLCHAYALAVTSIASVLGMWLLVGPKIATLRRTDWFWSAGVLFAGLLAVRIVLLRAHRSLLATRRLWVIGEDSLAANQLASKSHGPANRYLIHRISGPPSARELYASLPAFDAVLCTPALRSKLQPACNAFGKELLLVTDVSDVLLYTASAHQFDDLVVLSLPALRPTAIQRVVKRMLDIAGSALLMMLCGPVMAALYLLIPLQSTGRAIYRQERRGLHGRSLEMLKFRTMATDAEDLSGPVLASRRDARITRLGCFLRATRLDELPQLINVLR
jgi:hypothetical protein